MKVNASSLFLLRVSCQFMALTIAISNRLPNPEVMPKSILNLPITENYTIGHVQSVKVERHDAGSILESFVNCLKTFITEIRFHTDAFELQTEQLGYELSELELWVGKTYARNSVILGQLRFARRMFQVMKNAAESLRFYTIIDLDQKLLRSIIQLNVRILALHDSSGLPDPTVDGYSDKIYFFALAIKLWEKRFEQIVGASPEVQILFETQYTQAEEALQILKEFDPLMAHKH